jgi:hypothetical protein
MKYSRSTSLGYEFEPEARGRRTRIEFEFNRT